MTNPGGQITKWRLPVEIPTAVANENQLKLQVWAIDLSGNYRRNVTTRFQMDITAPEVQIAIPKRHQRVSRQFNIRGTFTDASEVTQVRLVIKNRDTGKFWNGGVTVDEWNYHQATLQEEDRWKLNVNLTPGRWLVSARGIDKHGNFASNVVTQYFVVE